MTPEELFESLAGALSGDARLVRARMFGSPGLKVNGKVFAMLVKGRLVVKLPRQRVEALVASGDGMTFDPGHGRLMKEWAAVEPQSPEGWLHLATDARDFVASVS